MADEQLETPGSGDYTGLPRRFVQVVIQERVFLALLAAAFLVAGVVYPYPQIAMWAGFVFAGYAVIANDSIQTIGTFIASNKHRPWWVLWLFIGGVMLVTMAFGWLTHEGDVTYGRLASKNFSEAPTEFAFLQVAGPLLLLVLTRMRIPVSTTFLILSSFAASPKGIASVLSKSVTGYVIAFAVAIGLWLSIGKLTEKKFVGEAAKGWYVAQWFATTFLWSMWLVQDAANVAVFLPRSLEFYEFAVFAGVLFLGLAVLFRLGGDKIQEIVEEKAAVTDVRHATIIDFVYALILWVFKIQSDIPMSTTWVFLGLLAGRELAINLTRDPDKRRSVKDVLKLIGKDLLFVTIGLIISIIIAVTVNPNITPESLSW
ncbi:hypothetical protein PPSIR1_08102 [Plesiocystis pacifica SIR-1]|uniref:Uncharacterized protein n=1 Tax=Plesiocystis pacifica SIR-1 TaxID=391625 RepID=A6GG50_9BACT|nr:hypothetical protein [Plesiocystis pacifica]EDM75178.1 hypothetical protein PPSIR1_08102 [Plesiocystis pacifica SIR-1]